MKIKGILDPFWETGTEGVIWMFNDPTLPGYYQMYTIKNRHLEVLDDNNQTLWAGKVKLEYKRNFHPYPSRAGEDKVYGQQSIRGYWVHGFQKDLDPELWADMFFKNRRAILSVRPKNDCPFKGSLMGFMRRFHACTEKEQRDYFSAAIYSWLGFFSDGIYFSIGTDIGLTYEEILVLLGNPTEEQITKAKTYPKSYGETLLPYSDELIERLFYLYRVYGYIKWTYPDSSKEWIHSYNEALKARPFDLIDNLKGLKKLAKFVS